MSDLNIWLRCKRERREGRLKVRSGVTMTKTPSVVAPQTPHQQFNSAYTTHPVTFDGGAVPGCRKSATRRQNTSSSAPFGGRGRNEAFVWIFCPSALCCCLLWHWRLESANVFTFDRAASSLPTRSLTVMDGFKLWALGHCLRDITPHLEFVLNVLAFLHNLPL